jgi:hypothetical protein
MNPSRIEPVFIEMIHNDKLVAVHLVRYFVYLRFLTSIFSEINHLETASFPVLEGINKDPLMGCSSCYFTASLIRTTYPDTWFQIIKNVTFDENAISHYPTCKNGQNNGDVSKYIFLLCSLSMFEATAE